MSGDIGAAAVVDWPEDVNGDTASKVAEASNRKETGYLFVELKRILSPLNCEFPRMEIHSHRVNVCPSRKRPGFEPPDTLPSYIRNSIQDDWTHANRIEHLGRSIGGDGLCLVPPGDQRHPGKLHDRPDKMGGIRRPDTDRRRRHADLRESPEKVRLGRRKSSLDFFIRSLPKQG